MHASSNDNSGSLPLYRFKSMASREPALLEALIGSWGTYNCVGGWKSDFNGNTVEISFACDEDTVLFMLSKEYSAMGFPLCEKVP